MSVIETAPEHTRCERCRSTQHYLTVTNEVRCHCEDRFCCARCLLDNLRYWRERAHVVEVDKERKGEKS